MHIRYLLVSLLLAAGAAFAQTPVYSPAQSAWLKGEIRRAQEKFVEVAASVSGVPAARIRQWAPADGTDTPPKLRVLPALERERGAPLTEEQRATVNNAEKEKIEAIERAKKEALKR